MGKRGPKKGEGGRPQKPINWLRVNALCKLRAPANEIADYLSLTGEPVSYQTLNRHCIQDHGITFGQYVKQKTRALCNISIRRAQMDSAIKDRSPAMLIWLGKQNLGQMDTQYMRHGGIDGDVIKNETTLKNISKEDAIRLNHLLREQDNADEDQQRGSNLH